MITAQEIFELNKQVARAREEVVRYEERKRSLLQQYQDLRQEIEKKGYNPDTLEDTLQDLSAQVQEKNREIQEKLTYINSVMSSIQN